MPWLTVQVTCNLFTLISMERMCGIVPWDHPWLQGSKAKARSYLANPSFPVWKGDPGLALVSYVMIQRVFGWDCIASTLASCNAAVSDHASDADKMVAWVTQLSLCTGHNLCAYYTRWGMPLPADLAKSAALAALPVWGDDPLALL